MTDQTHSAEVETQVRALIADDTFAAYRARPQLQCEEASAVIVERLAAEGIRARVVEYTVDQYQNHCVALTDTDLIIDVTYSQFDRTAEWPIIEPAAEYTQRHQAGPFDVDLIERWEDAGWDVDDMKVTWAELGLTPTP